MFFRPPLIPTTKTKTKQKSLFDFVEAGTKSPLPHNKNRNRNTMLVIDFVQSNRSVLKVSPNGIDYFQSYAVSLL